MVSFNYIDHLPAGHPIGDLIATRIRKHASDILIVSLSQTNIVRCDRDAAFYKDKYALSLSEVFLLLNENEQKAKVRNDDYLPNHLVQQTLDYSQAFGTNKQHATVEKIRT
jgi:hypothetical protein